MTWLLPHTESQLEFVREVEESYGYRVADCYQCGKCTAGCPTAFSMDYPPHQIMRGVQLGMRDAVLSSRSIWLCATCETCSARCPQDVHPAGVMDALRRIAYAEGIESPEQNVPLFHRVFLGSVALFGRVYEAGMMGFYNLFSGHYLKDVIMAPGMFLKGKLSPLPPRGGNRRELRRMFAEARELEAKLE